MVQVEKNSFSMYRATKKEKIAGGLWNHGIARDASVSRSRSTSYTQKIERLRLTRREDARFALRQLAGDSNQ